ncbi:UNVERIFIED_CONTAM: Zeatin O-xylosyltransferase [Sesamum radiatum]|uniref:Zeatin O-xylosyltransferase n=1 Tax=Sesamum radiatum TaxID=300843 RepID=A0AAW2NSN2_SESRA
MMIRSLVGTSCCDHGSISSSRPSQSADAALLPNILIRPACFLHQLRHPHPSGQSSCQRLEPSRRGESTSTTSLSRLSPLLHRTPTHPAGSLNSCSQRVVQDAISIHNAESYAFNCIPAFSQAFFIGEGLFDSSAERLKELQSLQGCIPEKVLELVGPNSVIYVSFGTTVSLSDEQIKELALGLEQSKVKFLWVLRDADRGDIFDGEVRRAELPAGFEERVKEMGMVVRDWAPQPEILAHESTGGFMSHCGWNSCIESITMGVPVAAWPMHSDQPRNTMFVTQVLKMGIVVMDWEQRTEIVKASAIENAVRRLMASEEGEEIRKRAEELAATLRQATEAGGASRLELDAFVAHITR